MPLSGESPQRRAARPAPGFRWLFRRSPHGYRALWRTAAIAGLIVALAGAALAQWAMPQLPAPELFGSLLLDSASTAGGVAPVVFHHRTHRLRYTCRVCHSELGFAMEAGATGVREADNRGGLFCGACHDGATAFGGGDPKSCGRCHSGSLEPAPDLPAGLPELPVAAFGNHVDWDAALRQGWISPRDHLRDERRSMAIDRFLVLEAEWTRIPPAIFSHTDHGKWLDCDACHPDPFNIKKKGTIHFSMPRILAGEFCGLCHGKVAFPVQDCRRCHPRMK